MKYDIKIRFKKEWRLSKSYDDSDYVTNDKYVNGDYDDSDYINYREEFYYDKSKSE